jgi:hypothetical protein
LLEKSYMDLNLYIVNILLFCPGLSCLNIGNPMKNHIIKNKNIITGNNAKIKVILNRISKNLLKIFLYIS